MEEIPKRDNKKGEQTQSKKIVDKSKGDNSSSHKLDQVTASYNCPNYESA